MLVLPAMLLLQHQVRPQLKVDDLPLQLVVDLQLAVDLQLVVDLQPHERAPHSLARPQVAVDDLLHACVLHSLARPQRAEIWAATWTFRG